MRAHGLRPGGALLLQQSARSLDRGAFHHDAVALGDRDLLVCHADAYAEQAATLESLQSRFEAVCGAPLTIVEYGDAELPLDDGVASHFFNSLLVERPDGSRWMVVPVECLENGASRRAVERLIQDHGLVAGVSCVEIGQSMRNGGGPACLRLRAALTADERAAMPAGVWFDDRLHAHLKAWARDHYRETLRLDDLADPALPGEARDALDALTGILGLGPVYAFQTAGADGARRPGHDSD
jgi:succinylarginine dihydrolase